MSYDIKTLSQVGITNTIEEGDYLLISQGGYLTKLPIVDGGAFTPTTASSLVNINFDDTTVPPIGYFTGNTFTYEGR